MANEAGTKRKRYTGAIDLAAAQPVAAAAVKKDSGVDLSQYVDFLRQSWAKKQASDPAPGFAFTISSDAVSTLKSRFQQAARAMTPQLGVAFEVKDAGNGNSRVVVEARNKKAAPAKKAANGSAAPAKPQSMPKPGGKR